MQHRETNMENHGRELRAAEVTMGRLPTQLLKLQNTKRERTKERWMRISQNWLKSLGSQVNRVKCRTWNRKRKRQGAREKIPALSYKEFVLLLETTRKCKHMSTDSWKMQRMEFLKIHSFIFIMLEKQTPSLCCFTPPTCPPKSNNSQAWVRSSEFNPGLPCE